MAPSAERHTTSSPTSPWMTISSSPAAVLLTLAPVANLLAIILAAFLRSMPKYCNPWICVCCLRFVLSARLMVIWYENVSSQYCPKIPPLRPVCQLCSIL